MSSENCTMNTVHLTPGSYGPIIIACIVLSGILVLTSLMAAAFVIVNRKKPIMTMGQWPLLLLFCVSIAFMNVGTLISALSVVSPDQLHCQILNLFLNVAFTLMLSSIAVKELRIVHLKITSQKLRVSSFKPIYGYVIVAICVVITIVLIIVWFSIAPPTPDPCQQFGCTIANNVFGIAVWVEQGILAVCLLIVTVMNRKITDLAAESTFVMQFAFLAVLIASVIAIFLSVFKGASPVYAVGTLTIGLGVLSVHGLSTLVFRRSMYFHLTAEQIRTEFLQSIVNQKSSSDFTQTLDDHKGVVSIQSSAPEELSCVV